MKRKLCTSALALGMFVVTMTRSSYCQDDSPILGEVIELAPCTTIDLGKDSKGFSACAKKALLDHQIQPRSDMPVPNSNKTNLVQAFENLDGCSATVSKSAMIIGHGQSGEVRVGGGDYAVDDKIKDSMYIADIGNSAGVQWNLSAWRLMASSQKIQRKFKSITLLGCETGSIPFGSALVSAFAAATESRVKAPTSKVWCDDNHQLRLEKGAGWTTAKDDSTRMGSQPRMDVELMLREKSNLVRIPINELNLYRTYSPKSIIAITRCVYKTANHIDRACKQIENRFEFLKLILFDRPIQPHAVPNAELTGSITLRACSGEVQKCETREFDVLNDNMVADTKTRTFYYVSEAFKGQWLELN